MKTRILLTLSLALLLFSGTLSAQKYAIGDTSYRNNLRSDTRIRLSEIDSKRQTPGFIEFREGQGYGPEQAAFIFSRFFPYRAGIDQLGLQSTTNSPGGLQTLRYRQSFKGIPVEHGSVTITAKNGQAGFIIAEYYAIADNTKTAPDIDETTARAKALQFAGAQKYDWEETQAAPPAGVLVLVEDQLNAKGMRLAYKFDIYAIQPLSRAYIYVDAADGSVLLEDRLLKHLNPDGSDNPVHSAFENNRSAERIGGNPFSNATGTAATRYSGTQSIVTDFTGSDYRLYQTRNGDVISTKNYQRRNQSTPNNALAVEFTDGDNNWTSAEYDNVNWDNAALDVQFAMQYISDYWQNIHARNSWDNAGGAMNSYVHVRASGSSTSEYDNAFWLGGTNAMFYGDGTYLSGNAGGFLPLTSLDVSGHELGHAVCQSTANLAYQKESGAMNEGFSDIWGACIENFAALGPPKDPWLIGEEIYPSAGYLRSMSNPKSQGQPDTYLGTYWVDVVSCVPSSGNDYCGVHTNSGVLNHWFYILTIGKSGTNDIGNSYNVTGIGFTDAQKIAYATELALSSGSTYANARTASISASTSLFGACSAQTIATTNAWFAVGVGTQFVPCGPEVYYKNAITTTSEFAAPVACPNSTKTINVTIRLENAATQQTDATLTISGGTATSGNDFSVSPSTVTWNAGATGDRTFTITINDDNNIEGSETIILGYTLNNHGGNAVSGSFNQTHLVNITDDEVAPTDNLLTAGIGTSAGYASFPTIFQAGTYSKKRVQHLYTAAQLTAAGFTKGNVNRLGFYFYNNPVAVTFNNFNLIIGNTAATQLNAGFVSFSGPTTTIFNGTLVTPTADGWTYFNMPNPTFYWDGISNILVEACFDNPATSTDVNLLVADRGTTNYHSTYVRSTSINVCGSTATNISQYQPLLYLRIGNTIQSTINLSKTAYLGPNADVSFFSATDGKIMARIKNNTSWDYGCTQVLVDRSGTGTTQFWRATAGNYLTNKTFRVLPTTNNPSGNYDITLYYTKAEHDGWEAATGKDWESLAKITKISGHDISEVTPATTALFSSVNVALASTPVSFGTDYQITAAFFNGFSGFGVGDPGVNPLPIELVSFTGVKDNDKSKLNWVTAFEQNNDRYEIETSKNGIDFYRIGTVSSHGNAVTNQYYAFTDNLPAAGANYYRLKQVDIDGHFTYSNVVLLIFGKNGLKFFTLYPVPAGDKLTMALSRPATELSITVYTIEGKRVFTENAKNIARTFSFSTSKLAPGTYLLESNIDNEKTVMKFVKQ